MCVAAIQKEISLACPTPFTKVRDCYRSLLSNHLFYFSDFNFYQIIFRYMKPVDRVDKLNSRKTWRKIGLKRRFRYYYFRLMRLRGHPRELALGTAFGIFAGMLPIIPFHMIVAVALSFFFKASKITAIAATWICNPITIYPIYKYCYTIGSLILGFDHKTMLIRSVSDAINKGEHLRAVIAILNGGGLVVAAFLLGGVILGVIFAIPSYFGFLYLFKIFISWRKSKNLPTYEKI